MRGNEKCSRAVCPDGCDDCGGHMERPAEQKPASAANNNTLSSPPSKQQQQQPQQHCVLVHFDVGTRREVALFRTDIPDDQLKGNFIY